MANMNNNDISAKELLSKMRRNTEASAAPEAPSSAAELKEKMQESVSAPAPVEEKASADEALAFEELLAFVEEDEAPRSEAEEMTFDDDMVIDEDVFEALMSEFSKNDEIVPEAETAESTSEADFDELDLEELEDYEVKAEEIPQVDEYAELADEIDAEVEQLAIEGLAGLEGDMCLIAEDGDVFDNDPINEPVEEVEEDVVTADTGEIKDFETLVTEVAATSTLINDELDETDISLMVALGMEDHLAKSIGREDAEQLTDDFVAEQEEWVDRETRFGPGEYSDMSENRKIAIDYTRKNTIGLLRVIAGLLLTVGLFFYENFSEGFGGVFAPQAFPLIYTMGGLQIFLFICALAYPAMIDGAKNLFTLKFTPASLAVVSSVSAVVSTAITAYSVEATVAPKLYMLPAAVTVFFAILSDYMNNRREIFSFNIVSSRTPKYVMRRLSTRDSQLENQAVSDIDTYDDENSGDIVKIAKTDFVDGYFWRTNNKGTTDKPFVSMLLITSLVLSVAMGVYAWVADAGSSAVSVAFTCLSAMVPASAMFISYYPFYKANKVAYYNDCTIIGEGSVEEYSDTEVISFDDVNVFPSINVKVRNVRLFNNCRIDKVLYYAASVFSATGGPLQDVFEVATMEIGHSNDVEIKETGTGYIEAVVNGKSILFSREDALLRHGISIPEEALSDVSENLSPDCSVMYMIYQQRLVAKMTFSYIIDADFEYILRQLSDSGMYVCVKTFDPNIDEDIINRQVTGEGYPLKVIKYKGTEEITKYSARTEGGIVSRGTTKALLQTIAFCDKIISAKKTGYVLSVASVVLTVLGVCFLMLTGGGFASIKSMILAANQLFWIIPALISTKSIVR